MWCSETSLLINKQCGIVFDVNNRKIFSVGHVNENGRRVNYFGWDLFWWKFICFALFFAEQTIFVSSLYRSIFRRKVLIAFRFKPLRTPPKVSLRWRVPVKYSSYALKNNQAWVEVWLFNGWLSCCFRSLFSVWYETPILTLFSFFRFCHFKPCNHGTNSH